MSTLLELSSSRHTGPLKRPLRVLVVAKGKPREYGDSSKKLMNIGVCDSTMAVRAVCFDETKFTTLKEGAGVVLHNCVYKQGELVLNSQTRLFSTSITVPEEKRLEALHMISPPVPPLTPIKDVAASPPKIRMTVRGIVTNVGLQTTANVNNRPTAVRQIEIQDGVDKVKVSLWRDQAGENYSLGQCIELTHVVRNARPYEGEIGLSTTQFTSINMAELPTSTLDKEILGIELGDNESSLMADDGTFYQVKTSILTDYFDATEQELDTQFPTILKIKVKGNEILELV